MKTLSIALFIAAALYAQPKTADLGNRALRGPRVFVLDSTGSIVAANIDAATLVLDPPGSAGGRPTLRAIVPPSSGATALRIEVTAFTYGQTPLILPHTPAPGTVPIVFWSGLIQGPTNYAVTGNVVTMSSDYLSGDSLVVINFWAP